MALLIAGSAVLFTVIALAYAAALYNGLVVVKNNIDKAWANIDVLLKQRHDEIPKLIKTCEAYMKYEAEALAKIVALRNAAAGSRGVAEKAGSEAALTAGLHKVFALAENYPDLKAQDGFRKLQDRISGLESQIADRREFYNESVNNYNIRIQSVPDLFVAGFMGLAAREMFKVADADRVDVPVDIKTPF